MRLTNVLGWAGFAALFLPLFSSCSHSPEGLCDGWAADTCQALTGCCQNGANFDPDGCKIALTESCQQQFNVEKIHAGEVIFSSGAAGDCLGTIETCDDVAKVGKQSFEHDKACAN